MARTGRRKVAYAVAGRDGVMGTGVLALLSLSPSESDDDDRWPSGD